MKSQNLILKTSISLLISSVLLTFASQAIAAPGTLANEPLQTSTASKPNIMFSLDSSGSMGIMSPEPIGTHTYTCASPVANNSTFDMTINGSGVAQIDVNGDGLGARAFGNSGTTFCFNPAGTYTASLTTDLPDSWAEVPYSGAYLNWYFDTSTDGATGTWTSENHKPGVRTRMEVAREAMSDMIDTLANVRVGLATFDSSSGADIDVQIADITAAHKTTIKTAITNTNASGSTPLAETLRDLGRYFSNHQTSGSCGGGSANLTIHPDEALTTDTPAGRKEDVGCQTLLANRINSSTNGPVEAFCQKNFAVMMTDGTPTSDGSIDSHLQDYDADCTTAAKAAGNAASGGAAYTCTATDVKSYDPQDYDYWDDVSQALYEMDLRPDMNDTNGNPVVNNLTTFTIGFADKQIENSQLIKDTATQGGGEFLYAADASGLSDAFANATRSIIEQSSTSSAVTFNSSTLSSQSAVYQALFNTSRWSGELRSLPLNGFTGDIDFNCTEGTNNCWHAATQLAGQSHSTTGGQLSGGRSVITYNPASNSGVAFQMPSDYTTLDVTPTSDAIPQAMLDDFCGSGIPYTCDATTAANTTLKTANQNYLNALTSYFRGDRSNEGATTTYQFRTRTSVLGDLVDSSPVFVGKPALGWPDTAPFPTTTGFTYSTWSTSSIKERPQIVYVASNDGMLHGFRTQESATNAADAGEEVIAYIPTGVLSANANEGLHYLADSTYQHQYYNDLTPTISDVFMKYRASGGTTTTDQAWRTVLLGGLRGGGRSLYLLDITDPANYLESKADQLVMWEFSHNDLGYTFSKPTIAMMNNGKFAAIFGNGYKSGEDGGSGDCRAKLFVVYLEGGLDGTWTAGTDYELYDTPSGASGDCNGLSTPAVVDLDGNGTADRVYAGDLKGNLWAFDICDYDNAVADACSNVSTNWGLAHATKPIMTANDGTNTQPITVKPIVARDPASSGNDDLLIVFGTGQYLTDADKTTTGTQTMYAVRDYDALANDRASATWGLDPRAGGSKFVEQTITETTACGGTCVTRTISDTAVGSSKYGWFIDLPTSGERVVVNPKIRSDIVFFNTLIPSTATCSFGGSGWLMSVNLENGGPPPRALFDLDDSGTIGDAGDLISGEAPIGRRSDVLPAESTFLGNYQYTPGSDGTITKDELDLDKDQRAGRMSWREIYENDD